MIIGDDFNNRAKQLLVKLAELTEQNTDIKLAVEVLVEDLNLDRTELKNLLEYLEDKDLVKIATIGGPFLYGHIYITERGLHKAAKLK
ncbi:MAG: hypothetical protein RI564_11505 [Gracilimonas sp.]|jgi:DNA-binding MarR family transcriptional regulator|nr:hypothetical protein [Gracilimonas sp.]